MRVTETVLFLEDLTIDADIGIYEFEIGTPQKLSVSVEIGIDERRDFASDRIEETVDYDFVRLEVKRLCEARRYNTQESLCLAILEALLGRADVTRATVSTKKLSIYPDAKAVGCRMSAQAPREHAS